MSLSGEFAKNYMSSTKVTQKYTPIQNLIISKGDSKVVEQMITDRIKTFHTLNVNFNNIEFIGTGINGIINKIVTSDYPSIAVVSSNRSTWINITYNRGLTLVNEEDPFSDVTDKRVLASGPVPIYAPFRFAGNQKKERVVCVFVHKEEFGYYTEMLRDTDLKVIGWHFIGEQPCVGFGASRFAAMEFFKNILRENPTTPSKVWMFDDNVGYIKNFPTLLTVEAKMTALKCTGLGFGGGSGGKADSEFVAIYKGQDYPPATTVAGSTLLQQAVLWNVADFNSQKINFSPLFFSSAEDVSMTEFLGMKKAMAYTCSIMKGEVEAFGKDNQFGVKLVNNQKTALVNYFFKTKSMVPFNVSTNKTLEAFIKTFPEYVFEEEPFNLTYSKSIELIILSTMQKKIKLNNIDRAFVFPGPSAINLKNV